MTTDFWDSTGMAIANSIAKENMKLFKKIMEESDPDYFLTEEDLKLP